MSSFEFDMIDDIVSLSFDERLSRARPKRFPAGVFSNRLHFKNATFAPSVVSFKRGSITLPEMLEADLDDEPLVRRMA